MTDGAPRPTGFEALDRDLEELVRTHAVADADLIRELLVTGVRMAEDHTSRGDLKIAVAAIREMRRAFAAFAPHRAIRKVSIFGSARTTPDSALYRQTVDLAARMAERDWMVITGAGPGIMRAGVEGAGIANSFGVSIRLPFETAAPEFDGDRTRLIPFRYFFTRKLMFMKESSGFVLLPGGFGTLDECFELLTLLQTGKSVPAPVVLLDEPGGTYWARWIEFIRHELEGEYVSPHDLDLVRVTDDVGVAVDAVTSFYVNYHSIRFVEGRLVIRLRSAPGPDRLDALSDEFADIIVQGRIVPAEADPREIAEMDAVDLERVALHFDRRGWARLRHLIDALNSD
ncbi:MAG: TIGR00730 family Rossman fold protein [Actinomycetes bacterium]